MNTKLKTKTYGQTCPIVLESVLEDVLPTDTAALSGAAPLFLIDSAEYHSQKPEQTNTNPATYASPAR